MIVKSTARLTFEKQYLLDQVDGSGHKLSEQYHDEISLVPSKAQQDKYKDEQKEKAKEAIDNIKNDSTAAAVEKQEQQRQSTYLTITHGG